MKCHMASKCDWYPSDPKPAPGIDAAAWYCATCGATSDRPPVSEARRRQNREHQRAYRERQKATDWKTRAEEAEADRDRWKDLASRAHVNDGPSFADFVKACGGYRRLLGLIHPDKHGNSRTSTKATTFANTHRPK